MINLLIVEDSRVVSDYLTYLFGEDKEINVIGTVSNGKAAIDFIKKQKPDVITMDIEMPFMDGLEATRQIMSTQPIPIIIVTASRNANEIKTSIEALAAGALTVMEKPLGVGHPEADKLAKKLVNMVKVMAGVSVVTRRLKPAVQNIENQFPSTVMKKTKNSQPKIIAIGVSTGGPNTLKTIFSELTSDFPVPIVVVQHIANGFLNGLVDWLQKNTKVKLHIANANEPFLPGHIYFAPDGYHLGVSSIGKLKLEKGAEGNGICPSVAHLLSSVKREFGENSMGILLTGMGSDGAKELKELNDVGGLTIAQSKQSALIYGMPGVAVQLGAADYVLSAEEIGDYLFDMEKNNVKIS